MKRPAAAVVAASLLLTLTACAPNPRTEPTGEAAPARVEIIVSAAASLADALGELRPAFEAQHPDIKVRLNLGSSGALQQQIEQGAPADLFIPASPEPVRALIEKGFVEPAAVANLATNRVVLVRGKSAGDVVRTWDDLKSAGVTRIAIGDPAHVPAGQYGKAVLENLGLWEAVAPQLVLGEDVRQVLAFVESGEVQAGILYRTDATASEKIVVLAEAPEGSHQPVVYPMAVLKESPHGAQARAFADYLLSPAGMAVLAKHGFGKAN